MISKFGFNLDCYLDTSFLREYVIYLYIVEYLLCFPNNSTFLMLIMEAFAKLIDKSFCLQKSSLGSFFLLWGYWDPF